MKKKRRNPAQEGIYKIIGGKMPFVYNEAYKALRTNVEFLTASNNVKKIVVTSALSGEGKTCLSINLAISLAQTGKKVIVLDCDLRKPKVHRYLRIKRSSQFGVSTVLSNTTDIDSSIGYLEELNLYVMLSGPTPPNPAELLNSERTGEMLKNLEERFDYIICDSAPSAIVTDAVALSQYCDGAIFVIRQNYATIDQINEAIARLKGVNAKILGTVLNDYNASDDSTSYYGQYYYYYSNKHYESIEE